MNKPIRNLFLLVVLLFGLLVAYTSRWTVFEDQSLRANPQNTRDLIRAERVPRGKITAADGTTLARSVKKRTRSTSTEVYQRRYPLGSSFVAPVGVSDVSFGQSGLEKSQNDWLSGKAVKLATAVNRLIDGDQRGDDVRTTLVPAVQRAAISSLNGRAGSVVAMDPRTGKVLALVSVPGFDPNKLIADPDYRGTLKDSALFNRATQAGYVPGSTFKVLTAAAALDSGKFTPDTMIDGSTGQVFAGQPLANFGGEQFGQVTLTQALTQSINGAFGNVAIDLGGATMQKYMKRFGFGAKPPLDFPADELRASGEYRKGKLIPATSKYVDLARLGIGQDKLNATPLQMAMVAAGVANGGRLMKPHLVDQIVDADGLVQKTIDPELYSRVMKPGTAAQLRAMMGNVVDEGTGNAAQLGGIAVGGKTGTAELGAVIDGINDLWFIGFAPLEAPKVAVAVIVENSPGQGGAVAAPIARDVIQAALSSGSGR